MQASLLLDRETGDAPPHALSQTFTSQLLRSFAPAPQHRFNGDATLSDDESENRPHNIRAHGAGVSSLAVEKFDGRILVSGGTEGAIKIWDLEACGATQHGTYTFRPASTIARCPPAAAANNYRVGSGAGGGGGGGGGGKGMGHTHGITHLAFYPFDPDAFLSSSYDKTLRLWSTATSQLSACFHLNATIYSHSTSPVADHLIVACATQHPHVRLVDLRSGSAVQALAAHGGPVLSTAWSPRQEHVLASGHADGRVRVWDVRRAGGPLAQLDQEDSLGVVHRFEHAAAAGAPGPPSVSRASAQAHDDAVNGLAWTPDARHILSAGLDSRIRMWDAATGANTLTGFGSAVQNRHAKTAPLIATPPCLSDPRRSRRHGDVLFWANDREILVLDLHDGKVVTRLRSPGAANVNPVGPGGAAEMGRNRISCLAWRSAGGGGASVGPIMGGGNSIGALYSAHLDGHIRAWMPQVPGPDDFDEDDEADDVDGDEESRRRRKRKAVDDAYRSLMGKQITFT
ncbi:DNA excision repair protein ERCC-8 [Geosmithia morbida]|uniref:DNA excision repair protein ERCC-8 n=1 Tax=Geosmithia morbida TaxID=1094350 RepID=A0A9P5D484_9HYPO|nr:DNA excision repair protein ERCC-8 [Geosmithia morbida]KAF4125777.1 DNA excision repair protein ERCC-8 [Geosmithia morbida]